MKVRVFVVQVARWRLLVPALDLAAMLAWALLLRYATPAHAAPMLMMAVAALLSSLAVYLLATLAAQRAVAQFWFRVSLEGSRALQYIARLEHQVRQSDNADVVAYAAQVARLTPLVDSQAHEIGDLKKRLEYWKAIALQMPFKELEEFRTRQHHNGDEGQALTEYSLLLWFVAFVIAAVGFLMWKGEWLVDAFRRVVGMFGG